MSDGARRPRLLERLHDLRERRRRRAELLGGQRRERLGAEVELLRHRGRGTGLGLATVYGVVQQSGGHIRVDSRLGQGTRFDVMLPRVEAADPAVEAVRTATPLPTHGPATVLVVDDEPGLRAVTARVLRRAGHTVLLAADAGEAVRVAAASGRRIDLLLTDVFMPGESGPDLARKLRAAEPGLRVLFTSGYTGDRLTRHGLATEAFLPKPYSMDELLSRVAEQLRVRRP